MSNENGVDMVPKALAKVNGTAPKAERRRSLTKSSKPSRTRKAAGSVEKPQVPVEQPARDAAWFDEGEGFAEVGDETYVWRPDVGDGVQGIALIRSELRTDRRFGVYQVMVLFLTRPATGYRGDDDDAVEVQAARLLAVPISPSLERMTLDAWSDVNARYEIRLLCVSTDPEGWPVYRVKIGRKVAMEEVWNCHALGARNFRVDGGAVEPEPKPVQTLPVETATTLPPVPPPSIGRAPIAPAPIPRAAIAAAPTPSTPQTGELVVVATEPMPPELMAKRASGEAPKNAPVAPPQAPSSGTTPPSEWVPSVPPWRKK